MSGPSAADVIYCAPGAVSPIGEPGGKGVGETPLSEWMTQEVPSLIKSGSALVSKDKIHFKQTKGKQIHKAAIISDLNLNLYRNG